MALFLGLPRWAGARRNLLLDFIVQGKITELHGAREDNRDRHNDNPAGNHSIWTNQWLTAITPHFCTGCPSCHNPPNLSWLGTGTKYAGLHTHWLGLGSPQQGPPNKWGKKTFNFQPITSYISETTQERDSCCGRWTGSHIYTTSGLTQNKDH